MLLSNASSEVISEIWAWVWNFNHLTWPLTDFLLMVSMFPYCALFTDRTHQSALWSTALTSK